MFGQMYYGQINTFIDSKQYTLVVLSNLLLIIYNIFYWIQWVQVFNKEKMTLHYNITYKHRQSRQHLSFVHALYKSTSALVNILIVFVKLQMSDNESTSTKKYTSYIPTTILQGNSSYKTSHLNLKTTKLLHTL